MGTNPDTVVFEVQGCRQQNDLLLLHSPKVDSVLCNTTYPAEEVTLVIIFAWWCGNPTQKDYFRSIPLCYSCCTHDYTGACNVFMVQHNLSEIGKAG